MSSTNYSMVPDWTVTLFLTFKKKVQQHLYSEQASVCVCDLYVVMYVSCCLELGRMRKYVTYGPSCEVFSASEALQKPTERRR